MHKKQKAFIAPISLRIKAFIIDTFMILMPILYVTTYLILNGKDDFQNSQLAISCCNLIFGIITSIFYSYSAQTLGYRSQEIYLVNLKSGKKLSFFKSFVRFLCFIIAGFSVIGIILCFFRTDKLNLHDILTNSAPVLKK